MNIKLINFMADMKEEETLALVKELLKEGANPMEILDDARSAMELVGKRFEAGEYFIPDLMMAGEILKGISDIVKPLIEQGNAAAKKGKVLIGTVAAMTSLISALMYRCRYSWTKSKNLNLKL
jgi:methanogenic corrinoid protein MtbC1